MKLSVIIVNYKVKYYVEQCLWSLRRALHGIDAEVYMVDNHSDDGSAEYITERFPEVVVIASNHNLGFSRANNLAIRQSCGEYVLLLNPDTIVAEQTIADVLHFMDTHDKSGGVGVRMLRIDGGDAMESRRGLPNISTAFYKMSGLCALYPKSRRFAHYYMGYLPWDTPSRIEVMSGAFCMLRRKALDKVGLLDEDYFMYGEDVDLSFRLLKGGFENWYVPSPILHYKGESAHKSSFRYVHVFYNAMLIFYRKHYGNRAAFVSLPIKAAIVLKATLTFIGIQIRLARKSLGFVSRHRESVADYVFIGSAKSLDECRSIARRRGIEAQFVEGNADTLPNGHRGMEIQSSRRVYVVYDTDSYTYDQIFSIFRSDVRHNVSIGTYSSQTGIIITGEEVIA